MVEVFDIIKEYFSGHLIFSVGLLLLLGYLCGQLAEKIKLPAITGYIIAGIIIGDDGISFIKHENMEVIHVLSEITLSFIALIIGGEFSFSKLKIYGKKIILLTLSQMFLTFLAVSFTLLFFGMPSYISFLLGAISAATAPAATVVIVEKLKARGEFVDFLYGIVALDDAGTVVLFSIAFAFSSAIIAGGEVHIMGAFLHAFKEIFSSIIIGLLCGFAIHFTTRKNRRKGEIKILTLGFLFLSTSIAISLQLSPLISNMTIGMLLINLSKKNIRILHSLEPFTPPLYAIFFCIAGTELSMSIFKAKTILIAGILFILARAFGKYFGIYFAGKQLNVSDKITKYMGFALLPQAGVAIGLVLFVEASPIIQHANAEIKTYIDSMINIVLISVFVNELLGPPLAKMAIMKSINRRNQ